MAEFVVKAAAQTLTSLITEEAIFLAGVSEKVVELRDDLQWMHSFLKDADAKQDKNERFRNWVSQIREVALDSEDVIEAYIYKASQSSWNYAAKLINRHKLGKKVERIRSRVQNISSQKEHFGITSIGREAAINLANERLGWWRHAAPNIMENDLVDLVEDTTELLTQLSSREERRRVVSIVGMGGLGKTTLAKKLYHHSDVNDLFDCKAFVYVSKEYNRRDTLQTIIRAVNPRRNMEDLKKLVENDLVSECHEVLKERRYLVVLDDIWEKAVWDSVQAAFPNGKMGSKVMLTTRNKEVPLYADPMSEPLEPRLLNIDESLKLLCTKAFPGMKDIPSHLGKLGRDMVTKCGGLPLAVVVLGGLLSTKRRTVEEWAHMLQNIGAHLIGEDRVSDILALSYNDLPFHLKTCFLHLGLFPEDSSISKTKLMYLWDAEGFLPEEPGGETSVDAAESCLNELVNRCMIQVGTVTSLGRIKTIRLHDVLRDFSVSKGKEEHLVQIYNGCEVEQSAAFKHSPKSRWLAIHADYDGYDFLKPYAPNLRSLQFSNPPDESVKDFICERFKSLRVLDGLVKPPKGLAALAQLRYLELNTPFGRDQHVPSSIGMLRNLRTLKIAPVAFQSMLSLKHGDPNPLPDVIWKMNKLRHLVLARMGENLRLDTLRDLQTLKHIRAGRLVEDGLTNMVYLRRLGITQLSGERADLVISMVADKLRYIHSLTMRLLGGESFQASIRLSLCARLQRVALWGKIETPLPEFPPNLVKLSLHKAHLQQDSIVKLERLPNLKMLRLGYESYDETKLICSSEGFPQLQVLDLKGLGSLEELVVEHPAMTELKHLTITCDGLRKLPKRFEDLLTCFFDGVEISSTHARDVWNCEFTD